MRRAATAVATALAAVALLPAAATAKPGFYKIPPSHALELLPAHGTHGYRVDIAVLDGRPQLTASRTSGEEVSLVAYLQTRERDTGDGLNADFGNAGKLKARFVPEKVREEMAPKGCVGGPTIIEIGWFVGNLKFGGANDFTSFQAHRLRGSVSNSPGLVCRKEPRGAHGFTEGEGGGVLRAITGTASGNTYFDAETEAVGGSISPIGFYLAFRRHHEGPVEILESAAILDPEPLAIPDLTKDLPATVTIEPPAPFSGSAALDAPSRATATLSGDLAVELPAAGKVPLTGPGIAAGLCRDYTCTKSLPKALRPRRSSEVGVSDVEFQTIR